MVVLGLRLWARAFPSCGKWGPLFIAVRRPLTIAASLVEEHRLQTRRLSSCGSRAQSLRGMWDLPRPGLEPVSPALAGRSSTTAPPGKPHAPSFNIESPVCREHFQSKEDGDGSPGTLLVLKLKPRQPWAEPCGGPPPLGSRHATASKTLPWPVGLTPRGLS